MNTRKVQILFLIDKLVAAGTQTNLLEIVRHLDQTRFSPHVVALVEGGALEGAFRATGVPVYILKTKKAYGHSGVRALFWLIRYIRKEKIDIVQNHFLHADLLGTLAAKCGGAKRVITARRDLGFWRGPRQLALNRFLAHFADRILVNSKAVKEATVAKEKVLPEKIHVIHNGIDTKRFFPYDFERTEGRKRLGIGEKNLVVGMVANMRHEVKGHTYLIQAMVEVLKEFPESYLVLVGDGFLRRALEKEAEGLGIRSRVRFIGSSTENQIYVNAMDVVCSSSLSEGFSNSILEAMASAKPVVATEVGGNPEAVMDGLTGFLAVPKNPLSLSGRIRLLLRDETLRIQMGEMARRRVLKKFSIETMIREYEDFYTGLMRAQPVKVCTVIWSLELGGAEQIVVDLATHLDRRFFEPMVCCLNEKGRFAPQLEMLGVKVVALHKRPKFDPWIIFKLVSVFKKEKVKLIHTHLFTANLWGRMAAKLAGIPVVSTEHGMDVWRKKHHLAIDRFLTPFNERMVFVSEAVRSFYETRIPSLNGKAKVIHNGINTLNFDSAVAAAEIRRSLGIGEGRKVIGIVGRLVPEKAHVDFIETIQILLEKHQDVVGVIVGEGKLEEQLKTRVREAGIEDRVIFTGFRSDVSTLYPAMDIFVMTSLREGFPLTILEAMAAGVPVVATAVGGVKECIDHGKDGLLVPVTDTIALVDAISKLLEDKELKARLIQAGKEKVRTHFNVERMVKDYESLYEEVVPPGLRV